MSLEPDGNSYARQRLGSALACLVDEGPLRLRLTADSDEAARL
jgi:hypothetical protein